MVCNSTQKLYIYRRNLTKKMGNKNKTPELKSPHKIFSLNIILWALSLPSWSPTSENANKMVEHF
jgi:hypothetical protein